MDKVSDAFFLQTSGGRRFCLFHPPAAGTGERGAVLHIHPFAEEMNRCRRMTALQSRALAAAGFGVLQIDLLGCGDSAGDFGDATWAAWLADVAAACAWLTDRVPGPLWLWGLRAGCLVAREAGVHLDGPVNFLFWQPTVSGKLFLHQFLRLQMAGEWLEGTGSGRTDEARRRLAAGEGVEIAGYLVSADLANGLEKAALHPGRLPGRVVWLELGNGAENGLAPASRKCIEAWRQAGYRVREGAVDGPPFWQTVEIAECPALIDATLAALGQGAET